MLSDQPTVCKIPEEELRIHSPVNATASGTRAWQDLNSAMTPSTPSPEQPIFQGGFRELSAAGLLRESEKRPTTEGFVPGSLTIYTKDLQVISFHLSHLPEVGFLLTRKGRETG